MSISQEATESNAHAAQLARYAILAAFPLSLTSPGATVAMAFAALCGLYLWGRHGGMPRDILVAGSYAAGLYILLLVVDVANGGGGANFLQTGINYLPVLALAPLALAIRRSGVTTRMLDRALQLTILIALAISLAGWFAGQPRPGGLNLNPIPYGLVILVHSTLLLFRGMRSGSADRFSVTVALLGIVPIVLTGSKIVWGCTIVSYAIALAYWTATNRRWAVAVAVLVMAIASLTIIYFTFARQRLDEFWSELREYADSGVSNGATFGHRMELAMSGWRAFLERPILGHGLDEQMAATFAHGKPGGPDVTMYNHLHNDYVTHLVSYGVFGALFLALFFLLFWRLAALSTVGAYRRAGYVIVIILMMYTSVEVAFNMDPVSGPTAMLLALMLASRVELGKVQAKPPAG